MTPAAAWLASVVLAAGVRIPAASVIRADLDGDGAVERIAFDRRLDRTVTVWRGRRRLWSGVPRAWRPWKLAIADVDGDGRREIVIGIHKGTPFYRTPHNCLFVYRVAGRTVRPRWLGSRLSLPFDDFAFARLRAGRAEQLVARERTPDGRARVTIYSWYGFGFRADRVYGPWRNARILRVRRSSVVVLADGREVTIGRGQPAGGRR